MHIFSRRGAPATRLQVHFSAVIAAILGLLEVTSATAQPPAAEPVPSGLPTPPAPSAAPPSPLRPSTGLRLQDAFERADRDSSDIRIARLSVERAETAERAALAVLLPQLSGNVSYTRFDEAVERMGLVIRAPDSVNASLVVSESISLRSIHATSVAGAGTHVATLQHRDARRLARAAVARTFFAALAADRAAALAREQLLAAERAAFAVRARAAAGVALALDVARADVAVLDATRRVADADATLLRAWEQLGAAVGADEPLAAIEADPVAVEATLADLQRRATADRADIRAAVAARELADLGVTDAWLRLGPTLTLSWTGSWSSATTTFNPDATSWTAVAALSIPLYDGGARYAARRDAELAVEQAEERLAGLRRRIRVEVRDAWRRVETAARALALAEQSHALAQRAARDAETMFVAGAATGLELDEARRRLAEAEIEVILRRLDGHLARVDLHAAAGTL